MIAANPQVDSLLYHNNAVSGCVGNVKKAAGGKLEPHSRKNAPRICDASKVSMVGDTGFEPVALSL